MTIQATPRPVAVDELKRAWRAVSTGEFRRQTEKEPRGRVLFTETSWSPAPGERTMAVLGCAGSAGASTVALAAALASTAAVRVVECCSVTASGLAAASTAELGMHPADWRQGKRDHVLLERTSEVFVGVDQVPMPTQTEHEYQLTILDANFRGFHL